MDEVGSSRALGKGWVGAIVALSALGTGVSLYLTRLHLNLFYGVDAGASLCDGTLSTN